MSHTLPQGHFDAKYCRMEFSCWEIAYAFKEEKLKKHLNAMDYHNRFGAECQHLVKMSLKLENARLKS